MKEIGRLCIKKCGREKGKMCVIVDVIDSNFVMVDGNIKRRKCNLEHLGLLPEKLEIHKGASTETIKSLFEKHSLLEAQKKAAVANKRERKGKQTQAKAAEKPKKAEKKKAPKKTSESSERQMRSSAENEDEVVEAALVNAES